MQGMIKSMDNAIYLNVGGVYFVTRRSTLSQSNSFFVGAIQSNGDDVELFVDRDPTHFRYILNWIRGSRVLPEDESTLQELLVEADYYSLSTMVDAIKRTHNRYSIHRAIQGIYNEVRQGR